MNNLIRQFMLGVAVIIFLSACTNLANLREILNTVSYDQANIAFQLNPNVTQMKFAVGETRGKFRVVSAQLGFSSTDLQTGILEVTIATGSVDLANPLVEEMLRTKEWFHSKVHKLATFRSTQIHIQQSESKIEGVLTIRALSQPISLQVSFPKGVPNLEEPPDQIPFQARGFFYRSDFGMNALTEFAPDRVDLEITGEFIPAQQIDSQPHIAEQ